MADRLEGLIFSEFLVDNAGAAAFDTDGDGTRNKSDEFIELQNASSSPISLDGFQVWSDSEGLLFAFGAGDTIAPGGTATIVGQYSGTPPAGFYDAGRSEGNDFLRDGEGPRFDTIYLVNTATGEYISFSYGAPPRAPTPPTGFTGTSLVGAGETFDSNGPNGTSFLRDANGDWVEGSPDPGSPGVACYAEGTMIATPHGNRRIEELRAGDEVITLDGGAASIRFMLFQSEDFRQTSGPRPIEIKAGALGPGRPTRDLIVSANHRILVGGQGQLEGHFSSEVFVPAKCLPHIRGVRVMGGKRSMNWVHFVLCEHAVVMANGCYSESMLPGSVALSRLKPLESRSLLSAVRMQRDCVPTTARPELTFRQASCRLSGRVTRSSALATN